MSRWISPLLAVALAVLATGSRAEEHPKAGLMLEELEIVGGPQTWPELFEPMTAIDRGLDDESVATRYAYRAAEYTIEAERLRQQADQTTWPGMNIYGDHVVVLLLSGWAVDLDEAANRSRKLAVYYYVRAGSPMRLAALFPTLFR